jgi:antitoxin component YwqK of YwqJK toxin-antitoxin module
MLQTRKPEKVRELTLLELERRDGVLFAKGEQQPFDGHLVESYTKDVRKVVIEIANGKAHGLSRGWYDNGQIEVEETFVEGVSHGPRTRWHRNGSRKAVAQIEHGKDVGTFTEWHENGQLAVKMQMRDGEPDGVVDAWFASGAPRSRVRFENGRQVEQAFWDDRAPL